LLVDDDAEIRQPFARWLRSRGYEVIEAENGRQGLTAAREHKPAIALLDVMMPEMSGWDLCRELKQTPDTNAIRVVMLTSIGAALNEMTSPQYGADAQLDKPFDFRVVEQTIERLLRA
jgi:two-component system sensor histidine kinase ChiS